jgi:hypothetical protein
VGAIKVLRLRRPIGSRALYLFEFKNIGMTVSRAHDCFHQLPPDPPSEATDARAEALNSLAMSQIARIIFCNPSGKCKHAENADDVDHALNEPGADVRDRRAGTELPEHGIASDRHVDKSNPAGELEERCHQHPASRPRRTR